MQTHQSQNTEQQSDSDINGVHRHCLRWQVAWQLLAHCTTWEWRKRGMLGMVHTHCKSWFFSRRLSNDEKKWSLIFSYVSSFLMCVFVSCLFCCFLSITSPFRAWGEVTAITSFLLKNIALSISATVIYIYTLQGKYLKSSQILSNPANLLKIAKI